MPIAFKRFLMRILFLISFFCMTLPAIAEVCDPLDVENLYDHNVLIERSAQHFSNNVKQDFSEVQRNSLKELTKKMIGTPNDGPNAILERIARHLADKSHLKVFSRRNLLFGIVNMDRLPNAMSIGDFIVLDKDLIRILKNDDELVAVIGHELLHQSLSHPFVFAEWTYSPILTSVLTLAEHLPGKWMKDQAVKVAQVLAAREERSLEQEVDEAMPFLLTNAGFDPWSITAVYNRLNEVAGPPQSSYSRQRLKRTKKRIERLEADFSRLGIQRPQSHQTVMLTTLLKALEEETPAARTH